MFVLTLRSVSFQHSCQIFVWSRCLINLVLYCNIQRSCQIFVWSCSLINLVPYRNMFALILPSVSFQHSCQIFLWSCSLVNLVPYCNIQRSCQILVWGCSLVNCQFSIPTSRNFDFKQYKNFKTHSKSWVHHGYKIGICFFSTSLSTHYSR
jgi:uncharacterized protein YhhL (DUF1145 family)